MKLLRDLFMNVGNTQWELARFMSAGSLASYTGAFVFALAKGHVPDWSGLGVGYAALLTGAGALIGLKDMARAKVIEADPATGGPTP